jgi:hypothetical protein
MKADKLRTADDLLGRLREEIRLRVTALASGTPRSYEEYQNLVGVITGLRTAEQLLSDLLESSAHDFDDPP